MSWHTSVANSLAENLLLERLCFASLELLVSGLVLALIVRWARFSSLRLVALLWLIVLAKSVVTLAVGSPIAVLRFAAPGVELSQPWQVSAPDLHSVSAQRNEALDSPLAATPDSAALQSGGARMQSSSVSAGERGWLDVRHVNLESLLLGAWALGAAFFCVRYLLVHWRLLRLVARADRAPEPFERKYAEITRELGLKRMPALLVTDELDSPALIGFLRPVILLPRWLVERGRDASAEWALRHELAHWKWLDPLAILVRDVVSILFFFHPTLPWVARRHAEAMEMACDWESLRDPSEAPDYAEVLCKILSSMQSRQTERANAGALAMATHGRMARRIAALLEGRRARPLTTRSAVGIGLMALLVFSFGCGVSRPKEEAGERPAPIASPNREISGGKHARGGATQGTEKSVLDGLRWLVRHQNPDGSWSPTTLNERCPCNDPIYNPKTPFVKEFDEGLTGLALMCFLGAGFSDESTQDVVDTAMAKRYNIGDVVRRGLEWLVARQHADGSFSQKRAFMYNEALASMAVTKAFGLTRSGKWKEPAQKSIDFIQLAQRPSPSGQGLWGWRYASRQDIEGSHHGRTPDEELKKDLFDADTSITGWCIMALESGVLSGLTVGQENLDGGLAFAKFVTPEGSGNVGYLDPKGAGAKVTGKDDQYVYHPATMSALGMCIRIFTEHDQDDPVLDRSAQVIVKDLPTISKDKLSIDYYYWYHASLALNQIDGPDAPKKSNNYWGPWNKALVDTVLALQDHTEHDCRTGGWMVPDRWSYDGGPIYTTAINVLTLEVYYRYENAFGGARRK